MRVNSGTDLQADAMGSSSADQGTSTGTAATTLTDTGKSWTVNQWAGRHVVTGQVYGVVLSNSSTVLTIDRWSTPSNPGGAAAGTPATGSYVIAPGNQPAFWMAVTENATAPAATDTVLTGELTTGGFARAVATYAHTAAATSYTLTKTFTSSDGTTRTPAKMGIFDAQNAGRMLFETAIPSPPAMVSGDALSLTDTVSL